MSIDLQEEAGGRILVVKLHGTLARGDHTLFTRPGEQLIAKHGTLRIVCHMHGFHGWDTEAPREDLDFYFRHLNDIERLAFVGDKASEGRLRFPAVEAVHLTEDAERAVLCDQLLRLPRE